MNLKEAKRMAKLTGETQIVTEAANMPSTCKVNISIRLDLDLLNWLKLEAKKQGLAYQTLTQSILRKAMLANQAIINEDFESSEMFIRLKKELLADIEPRLSEIEHIVHLKQG